MEDDATQCEWLSDELDDGPRCSLCGIMLDESAWGVVGGFCCYSHAKTYYNNLADHIAADNYTLERRHRYGA